MLCSISLCSVFVALHINACVDNDFTLNCPALYDQRVGSFFFHPGLYGKITQNSKETIKIRLQVESAVCKKTRKPPVLFHSRQEVAVASSLQPARGSPQAGVFGRAPTTPCASIGRGGRPRRSAGGHERQRRRWRCPRLPHHGEGRAEAQVRPLQEPRHDQLAQGTQTPLQVQRLHVCAMQPHRRAPEGDGSAG